jgi:hypothetical protein
MSSFKLVRWNDRADVSDGSSGRLGLIDLKQVGIGFLAGLVAGILAVGFGARIAMRIVALVAGMRPNFSFEGTLIVLIFGATFGVIFGIVFVAVRRYLPLSGLRKGLMFGVILLLLIIVPPFLLVSGGELALVPPLAGLAVFGPIPIAYGILLAAAVQRFEQRSLETSPSWIGLPWLSLFGLALMLAVIGMTSLMGRLVPMPPAVSVSYRNLGLTFISAHEYHAVAAGAFALTYLSLAGLVLWRGAHNQIAKYTVLTLLVFAGAFFNSGETAVTTMHSLIDVRSLPGLVRALGLSGLTILFYVFPDGRFTPRSMRPLAVVWCLWTLVWFLNPFPGSSIDPHQWPEVVLLALVIGSLASGVVSQVYRYRRDPDPGRRLQTRWPVVGFAGATLAFGLLWASTMLFPDLRVARIPVPLSLFTFALYLLPWLLIPLSIAYAILRHGLWAKGKKDTNKVV